MSWRRAERVHLRQASAAASFLSLRSARAPWSNEEGDDDAEGHAEEDRADAPTRFSIRIMMIVADAAVAFECGIIPRNVRGLARLHCMGWIQVIPGTAQCLQVGAQRQMRCVETAEALLRLTATCPCRGGWGGGGGGAANPPLQHAGRRRSIFLKFWWGREFCIY